MQELYGTYTLSVVKVEKLMDACVDGFVIQIVQEISTAFGIWSQKRLCRVRYGHSDLLIEWVMLLLQIYRLIRHSVSKFT